MLSSSWATENRWERKKSQVEEKARAPQSIFKEETILGFCSEYSATHHCLHPAGVGEQPVETDDSVWLPRGADVDHRLGGRDCMEGGGPETFWGSRASSTPCPGTGGFSC